MSTVTELLARIDELQARIASFGKLDAEVLKKIQYKFRLDWNYHSNALEGNSLTQQETRSVMINNITIEGKPLKDIMEVRGHDTVITDILKIGKGELRLSEKRIKDVHRAIMHEDAEEQQNKIGKWKTENNHLINYREEKFDFTPVDEVPERMHELLNWLNAEYDKIRGKDKKALHPALLAFEFHLKYVTVHPFYDGNGRTARIFTNLILIALGFPPVIVKVEEKNAYNQYLADIQAYGGPPDLFYEFMSRLLIRSQEMMLDAIEGKEIDEPDDLDKEILLWKKQLKENEAELVFGSNDIIYKTYIESIRPFFVSYLQKMKQFDDLFGSQRIAGLFNNSYDGQNLGLISVDKNFEERITAENNSLPGKQLKFKFYNIGLWYDLIGFKKDGGNTFTIKNKLVVEFDQYVFRIIYNEETRKEPLYSEPLSVKDIQALTNECIKVTFDLIRSKVKES